jgi:predicted esterase
LECHVPRYELLQIMAPDAGTRKQRILCLHGYSQNGTFFRAKTGSLRKACKSIAEFVYIDAPHAATADFLDIEAIAGDRGQPLSWWNWDDGEDRPASSRTYQGIEQSLEAIQQCIEQRGPFDGVLGFSQGAALAALLCRRATCREAAADTPGSVATHPLAAHPAPTPAFRFAILISGFVPRDGAFAALFDGSSESSGEATHPPPPSQLPSLHVYGLKDERVPHTACRRLAACFQAASHHPWDGGHAVPCDAPFRNRLKEFIASVMAKAAARDEHPIEPTPRQVPSATTGHSAAQQEADRCKRDFEAWHAIRGGAGETGHGGRQRLGHGK